MPLDIWSRPDTSAFLWEVQGHIIGDGILDRAPWDTQYPSVRGVAFKLLIRSIQGCWFTSELPTLHLEATKLKHHLGILCGTQCCLPILHGTDEIIHVAGWLDEVRGFGSLILSKISSHVQSLCGNDSSWAVTHVHSYDIDVRVTCRVQVSPEEGMAVLLKWFQENCMVHLPYVSHNCHRLLPPA